MDQVYQGLPGYHQLRDMVRLVGREIVPVSEFNSVERIVVQYPTMDAVRDRHDPYFANLIEEKGDFGRACERNFYQNVERILTSLGPDRQAILEILWAGKQDIPDMQI
jgi:hypothetical protein